METRRIFTLALGACMLAFACDAPAYELGKGYRLPYGGLTVGGYLGVHYHDLRGEKWGAEVRDLSLFLSADIGDRWHFFSETEIGDAVSLNSDRLTTDDSDGDLERLYLDYRGGPRWNLRIGKFLTPVGQWNLVHADPLVWTVSRPLTTAAAFGRHATGLMVHGTRGLGDNGLDYALFVDATNAIDPTERTELKYPDAPDGDTNPNNAFDHAVGGQVRYRAWDDRMQVGASALHYRLDGTHQDFSLAGMDLHWTIGRSELSAEGIYRRGDGPDEWGGFAQLVVPVAGNWYAVGYLERYKPSELDTAANVRCLGLVWQPRPTARVKLERREGSHNQLVAPDAWLASFAVLF